MYTREEQGGSQFNTLFTASAAMVGYWSETFTFTDTWFLY